MGQLWRAGVRVLITVTRIVTASVLVPVVAALGEVPPRVDATGQTGCVMGDGLGGSGACVAARRAGRGRWTVAMDVAVDNVAVILVVAEGLDVVVGEVVDLVVLLLLAVGEVLNKFSSSWKGAGPKGQRGFLVLIVLAESKRC